MLRFDLDGFWQLKTLNCENDSELPFCPCKDTGTAQTLKTLLMESSGSIVSVNDSF